LGRTIPNISQRIHYVIAVVILLSILPAIISILRARRVVRSHKTVSQPTSEAE